MNFNRTIQRVEEENGKNVNEFTIEDMLGIISDLYEDVNKSFKDAKVQGISKVEDIKVEDDSRFVKVFNKLFISMGKIYNINKSLFSEGRMTPNIRRAIEALSEVEEQSIILDNQINEAEARKKELERKKDELEKKKDDLRSIEFQSQQLAKLKLKYENMLAKVDTLQQEIDNYASIKIPNIEEQIKTREETYDKLSQDYSELCGTYEDSVQKNREIQQEIERKEKDMESAQLECDNYRQQIFESEETKNKLQEESKSLCKEKEKLEREIEALKLQNTDVVQQIEIIKTKTKSLNADIQEIMADQNYWEAEQNRAQAEYDRVLKSHTEAKNSAEKYEVEYKKLGDEIDLLKKKCEEEKAKISDSDEMRELYKSKYAEIKKAQEDKYQEIDNQKKRMKDAMIDLYILKVNMERVIRNSQIQHENLEKKQLQLADQIKPLIELVKDENLKKIYDSNDKDTGYEMVRTLRAALETVRKQTNDQIRHEKEVFADTLRKLETDEIYGGV